MMYVNNSPCFCVAVSFTVSDTTWSARIGEVGVEERVPQSQTIFVGKSDFIRLGNGRANMVAVFPGFRHRPVFASDINWSWRLQAWCVCCD